MANEYKKTTNLPRTGFPMRASLAQNEPKRLALWTQNALYELLMKNWQKNLVTLSLKLKLFKVVIIKNMI